MNLPAALFTVRWLIQDTFRQSRASGIFWLMLGVSTICILTCLSIDIVDVPHYDPQHPNLLSPQEAKRLAREKGLTLAQLQKEEGVTVIEGQITFAFGAISIPWNNFRENSIRFVQFILAGRVADTMGVLLALIWTAGFLPSFLQKSSASVLLAKPVPRWSLLAGKYLGVLIFVAFQLSIFVFGTWLALGARTGVWSTNYLLCLPVVLMHFAVFFSFCVMLAVSTRSTVACVFGSLVFWLVCWGMNYGRHVVMTVEGLESAASLAELGYWFLPKPADFGVTLLDALKAHQDFPPPFNLEMLQAQGDWHPGWSLLSSFTFALVLLGISAREFITTDY